MLNPFPLLNPLNKFSDISGNFAYGNAKIKTYPDGTQSTVYCRVPIFRNSDYVKVDVKRFFYREFSWSEERESFSAFRSHLNFNRIKDFLKVSDIAGLSRFDLSVAQKNVFEFNKSKFLSGLTVDELRFVNHAKSRVICSRYDSLKRAKDRIFDYTFCNDFDYFFTGTINPSKLDSTDSDSLLKPIQNWLKNRVKLNNLKYVLVAEYHKSGRIHFHGLFKGDNLNFVDSGTKSYLGYKKPMRDDVAIRKGLRPDTGKTVYNLANWSFGFSTCMKTYGDTLNVAYYITKYITKDCSKIFGKFFWHSRSLRVPEVKIDYVDYDSIDSVVYKGAFKYTFVRGSELRRRKFDPNFYDICFDSECCYNSKTGEFYYSANCSDYVTIDYETIC